MSEEYYLNMVGGGVLKFPRDLNNTCETKSTIEIFSFTLYFFICFRAKFIYSIIAKCIQYN